MNYTWGCRICGWTGERYHNLKRCPKCHDRVKRLDDYFPGNVVRPTTLDLMNEISNLRAENFRLREALERR